MANQDTLLTKLNPRYVRVFKSLPWLGIEFYVSKISMSFYRNIVCKNIVCISPYQSTEAIAAVSLHSRHSSEPTLIRLALQHPVCSFVEQF